MLMAIENNTDPSQANTPDDINSDPITTDFDSISPSTNDQTQSSPGPSPLSEPLSEETPAPIDPPSETVPLPGDMKNKQPAAGDMPMSTTSTQPTKKKRSLKFKIGVVLVVVLVGLAISAAYMVGKHNERVVIETPPPQPINLPPQAVVVANCVPGRGKQYIIPKDIPGGPIYDVENSKVIAIEYNLNLNDLESNPNTFSDAILKLTKDYPVNHFSIVPVTPKSGESLQSIHLIMFVVSKAESAKITCVGTSSSST
jgi:hypothetical protein